MSSKRYDGPAIVHVGYIKTASTFLQHEIFPDERLGFGLPGGADSRSILVDLFFTSDPYLYDPARMAEELAQHEAPLREAGLVPVWSEETLIGNPLTRRYHGAEIARKVAELPARPRVLITIRRQEAWVLSAYREHMKSATDTLTDFIGVGDEPRSFTPIVMPGFLRYERAVAAWQARVGAENVLVLPVEMLQAAPDEFLGRLAAFAGVPAFGKTTDKRANVGMGGLAMRLALVLNRFAYRSPLRPKASPSERFARRSYGIVTRLAPASWHRRIEARMKQQIDARYQGYFADGNRELERLTGLDLRSFGYQ